MEKTLSFEEAMTLLEDTVQKMEDGKTTLAEMIALYEEGMRLAAICGRHLDGYEAKIRELSAKQED